MHPPDSPDFGPPLKLATRQQLALEMTDRDDGLMAVCAWQLPGGEWDVMTVMSSEFGDPPDAPKIFRYLAGVFENAEHLPRPKGD